MIFHVQNNDNKIKKLSKLRFNRDEKMVKILSQEIVKKLNFDTGILEDVEKVVVLRGSDKADTIYITPGKGYVNGELKGESSKSYRMCPGKNGELKLEKY